jgi:hypothetical protein
MENLIDVWSLMSEATETKAREMFRPFKDWTSSKRYMEIQYVHHAKHTTSPLQHQPADAVWETIAGYCDNC